MIKKLCAIALMSATLAGCVSNSPYGGGGYGGGGYGGGGVGMNQGLGTLGGAVVGGVVGNQFGRGQGKVVATVAGALLGGLAGNQIGAMLDDNDRQRAAYAESRALGSGAPTAWRNPQSGRYGQINPGPVQGGCRNYTHTIYVDGQPQTARGSACRNPDGTWSTRG